VVGHKVRTVRFAQRKRLTMLTANSLANIGFSKCESCGTETDVVTSHVVTYPPKHVNMSIDLLAKYVPRVGAVRGRVCRGGGI